MNITELTVNELQENMQFLEFEIENIKISIEKLSKEKKDIDFSALKIIYEEAKRYVPELQKSFEDMVSFHNAMIQNRIDFIYKQMETKQELLELYSNQLNEILVKKEEITIKSLDEGFLDEFSMLNKQIEELSLKKGEIQQSINLLEEQEQIRSRLNKELIDIEEQMESGDLEDKIKEYNFDDICSGLELNMHNITYKTSLIKNSLKLDNCFYTDTQYVLFPMKDIKTVVFLENYIYMYRVSLDTQSVNINSLQKHCDMHELVLASLIKFYKENYSVFNETRKKYVAERIAKMVGTQLYIYLSYNPSNEYKLKIKKMLNELKVNNNDIYNIISKKKTVKLLKLSKYALYKFISSKVRKNNI